EANRQRLLAYQQLLADLDGGRPPLSDRVDEVYLEDVEDIRLRPTDRRVMVVVGARHFRARLKSALEVLEAVDRRDLSALRLLRVSDAQRLVGGGRIAYLNTTHEERVVVGLAQ
ncbi:MAG TPA: hypothetical protein VFC61_08005, partial [Blastocatellia bacterium]|nr:hypothetical protein [Blastocatellia bacterium]